MCQRKQMIYLTQVLLYHVEIIQNVLKFLNPPQGFLFLFLFPKINISYLHLSSFSPLASSTELSYSLPGKLEFVYPKGRKAQCIFKYNFIHSNQWWNEYPKPGFRVPLVLWKPGLMVPLVLWKNGLEGKLDKAFLHFSQIFATPI